MADKDLSHIPGDDGAPLFGHSLRILRDSWGFDRSQAERYGPVYRARFLGRTNVSLTTVDLVGTALLDRARNLSNKRGWSHLLGGLFDNGLMLRDFDDHQRHRKPMQFAFRTVARRGYHETLERQVAGQLEAWTPGETFEFYPRIRQTLLEQAGRVLLGVQDSETIATLLDSFVDMISASLALIRVPLPGTAWRRGQRGRRRLEAFFRAEIPKRRASGGEDLLSVLCQAEDDEGWRPSDEDIVDHMIFLLFASHDTTATALATLIDELTRAPELQAKAAAECRDLAERAGEVLSFDDLDALDYIDRCTREALRLNPPVPYVPRTAVEDCTFGGHEIPAGAAVLLHIKGVQHAAEHWADPLRFDPERFVEEQGCPRSRPAHAWAPFGGGAHRCIGAELARQQIKVFMFHLLTRYRVERVSSEATRWQRLPLPAPKDGLPVRLVAR